MGWTFHYNTTKEQLVRELTELQAWTREDGTEVRIETLKHTVRGSRLWALRQHSENGEAKHRYILLCLLQADRKHDGYGYKDMDESMGPYYYDCPISWLDQLTEPVGDYAAEWRQKVREHHAQTRARKQRLGDLSPGQRVLIYGKEYTYEYAYGRGRLAVRKRENGQIYSARPSQLTFPGEG